MRTAPLPRHFSSRPDPAILHPHARPNQPCKLAAPCPPAGFAATPCHPHSLPETLPKEAEKAA